MEWKHLLSLPLKNPFTDKAIHDPQMFFNQGKLLNRVYSLLAFHQSISLVGLPRIGKTSILRCLSHHEIQKRYGDPYKQDLRHHL